MMAHQETLYKTAYLYLRNKEDALDAVQETAYKAFISIEKLKEPKYFLTWLTRILIHSIFAMNKRKENWSHLRNIMILEPIKQILRNT